MNSGRVLRTGLLVGALGVLSVVPGSAQTSASYKLQETSINSGGIPGSGGVVASTSYRLSFAALGDGAVRSDLASTSFHMDGGFVGSYAPPRAVTGVRFTNGVTLQWDADPTANRYEVYKGTLGSFTGFGTCFANNLMVQTTTDISIPSTGTGNFYLVTSRNRLMEEGTKGYRSNGTERENPLPCP